MARYFEHLRIDIGGVRERFYQVADDWQRLRNSRLIPAFESLAGIRDGYSGPLNFWEEWPRGCSKTSDIARFYLYLLCYSRRKLRLIAAAADKDQAAFLRTALETEHSVNDWLPKLKFSNYSVNGPGGVLEVLASDAATNQGRLFDACVFDEISVWRNRDLYDALISASVKRAKTLTLVLTNAGIRGSWSWDVREVVRELATQPNPPWHFYGHEGRHPASWMSAERIAEVRRTMLPSEARRLYDGIWIDPTEDRGFLSEADVLGCVGDPLPPPAGAHVALAIDYGPKKDRTALAAAWWDGARVHLFELEAWQGSEAEEVPLAAVDAWIDERTRKYGNVTVVVDPYQMVATAQRLEGAGVHVVRYEYRGGKGNYKMAECLRSCVVNKKIVYSANAGRIGNETLADELKKLLLKRMSYGFRFDHASGQHDDRSCVAAMAAMQVVEGEVAAVEQKPGPPREPKPPGVGLQIWTPNHAARRNLFGLGRSPFSA